MSIAVLFLTNCEQTTKSDKTEPQIVKNLVNEEYQQLGRYIVHWFQTNNNEEQVTDGNYTARLTTAYLTDENSIDTAFNVSTTAPHIPVPNDSLPSQTSMPNNFSISTNSENYALSDTVIITYELPIGDSNIMIDIMQ